MAKIMESDKRMGLGTSMGKDVPSGSDVTWIGDIVADIVSILVVVLSSSGTESSTLFDLDTNVNSDGVVCRMVALGRTVNGFPTSK